MPFGLPAASVTTSTTEATAEDGSRVFIPYQSHVAVLYPCADQDGWDGEVMCEISGKRVALQKRFLRLPQ